MLVVLCSEVRTAVAEVEPEVERYDAVDRAASALGVVFAVAVEAGLGGVLDAVAVLPDLCATRFFFAEVFFAAGVEDELAVVVEGVAASRSTPGSMSANE